MLSIEVSSNIFDGVKLQFSSKSTEEVMGIIQFVFQNMKDNYEVEIIDSTPLIAKANSSNRYKFTLEDKGGYLKFTPWGLLPFTENKFQDGAPINIDKATGEITMGGEQLWVNLMSKYRANFNSNDYIKVNSSQLGGVMYMIYNIMNKKVIIKESSRQVEKTVKVKNKNKKGKKNVVKNKITINKPIIVYTTDIAQIDREIELEGNKRQYNRKTEGWEVRGFWRTYKSGKKVWINSFKKGDKSKAIKNIYKYE